MTKGHRFTQIKAELILAITYYELQLNYDDEIYTLEEFDDEQISLCLDFSNEAGETLKRKDYYLPSDKKKEVISMIIENIKKGKGEKRAALKKCINDLNDFLEAEEDE